MIRCMHAAPEGQARGKTQLGYTWQENVGRGRARRSRRRNNAGHAPTGPVRLRRPSARFSLQCGAALSSGVPIPAEGGVARRPTVAAAEEHVHCCTASVQSRAVSSAKKMLKKIHQTRSSARIHLYLTLNFALGLYHSRAVPICSSALLVLKLFIYNFQFKI